MDDAFRFVDDLGPAKVILIHEPASGLKAALVVDNVAAGPSIGGLRMAPDVSMPGEFRLPGLGWRFCHTCRADQPQLMIVTPAC